MAGSPPNLHTMVPRRARIQGVLKVKVNGDVTGTLLWFHEKRFFSQANGWITTKLAHDGPQKSLHPDVLKVKVEVKGHVIGTLLWFHKNRFFSQANGWNATKLVRWFPARPAPRVCSRSKVTWYGHYCDVNVCYTLRSHVLSLHMLTLWSTITLSFQYKYQAARSNV